MKDFIKMVLAVFCALLLIGILSTIITVGALSSVAASSEAKTVLPKNGVLKMDFSELAIVEQSKESDPMEMIQGNTTTNIGIWDAVQAINSAAEDPGVSYIYLKPDGISGGISHIEELRVALEKCKKSGKAVISYLETPTTASYYLASVSDKVYLSSAKGASSMIIGISGRLLFLKDILDKVGINMQLIRHGKYKSAGEMYIKNAPSPENMEQNQVMINSFWNKIASDVAQSRDITAEEFTGLVDDLKLNFAGDLVDNKLADGLLSKDELEQKLAELANVEKYKDVKFINIEDYISSKIVPNLKVKQKIAVIYADGQIIDGDEAQEVAGDRFASEIAKVRKDSSIKAVVLRVNSPGGSVIASDKIKTELDLVGEQKPLIASFGDYAASGGYWISNNCRKIYSDATTLTGSIGVFSMIPDMSKAVKNTLMVNMVSVNSNKHSDMYSLMRPLDSDEIAYAQASIEDIYEHFVGIVAEGRGLRTEFVDSIAQGRVWTGSDALQIGLVDEIGTLEDAINYAMTEASEDIESADLSKWRVVGYPKPKTTLDMIMERLNKKSACVFEGTIFESTERCLRKWAETGQYGTVLARMPYDIEIM